MIPDRIRTIIDQHIRDLADYLGNDPGITSEQYDAWAMDALGVSEWLDSQPEAPVPAWSQAPDWAQWAVAFFSHSMGRPINAVWSFTEQEPIEVTEFGYKIAGCGKWTNGEMFDIPFGVDPRTLKQRRPEAT